MSDLEQALNGEVSEETEVIETPPEVVEPIIEATEEAPTGEEVASPPEDNEVAAFKAKAIDETRKRQELEQRFNDLQAQVNSKPQEKPEFWDDPDKAISQITHEFDSRLQQVSTNVSVQIMRSLHDDYDQMEADFVEQARANPALIAQMNQSDNPAKFAYDYGKSQQQLAEVQDPGYRDKVRAELRAEMEAEQTAKISAEIDKRSALPGSLANDRAAGGNTAVTTARPELDQLIG